MQSFPRQYDEKRDFIRMKLDSKMRIETEGNPSVACTCRDLSSSGVRFWLEREIPRGQEVRIIIPSSRNQLPSLHAIVRALRTEETLSGFKHGARIVSILDSPNQ